MEHLKKTLDLYAKISRKSSAEIAKRAAQLFAQNAQKETLLQTGQGKQGRASSLAVAARVQKEALRKRILENRLKRRSRRTSKKVYLTKAQARQHWKEVQTRLREIAAPFSAAINATDGKIQTAKLRKIGEKHGTFQTVSAGNITNAAIRARYPGGELAHALNAARKTVRAFFSKQAGAILRNELRKNR